MVEPRKKTQARRVVRGALRLASRHCAQGGERWAKLMPADVELVRAGMLDLKALQNTLATMRRQRPDSQAALVTIPGHGGELLVVARLEDLAALLSPGGK